MNRGAWLCGLVLAVGGSAGAQVVQDVAPYVSVATPTFALAHVRVIDGTGAEAKADQTVVVRDRKIVSIEPSASAKVPAGITVIDKTGYTVIPGLVGMHDHLFFTDSAAEQLGDGPLAEPGLVVVVVPFTGPRLYLAAGVTTMRTTGSLEPYTDLKVKQRIDAGEMVGPNIDMTAPYLEGAPTQFAQMHELTDANDARRMVDYWISEGATSFKAYMNITRAELGAAIEEAHAHKMKLTGHLCSVTWHEAIALGIDDLEHGPVFADTGVVTGKKPDVCPTGLERRNGWLKTDMKGAEVQALIKDLVDHHVAVTSTLPVFELSVPGRPKLQQRVLDAMSAAAAKSYLTQRARVPMDTPVSTMFKEEMEFELAFVKAGGVLLAGPDPTGMGGVLPGFGDQREVELLVETGFSPVEAIRIATKNGADYLGRGDTIGTLAEGKVADMVLIKGDPATKIEDIEQVETVFKNGVGYDSAKLIASVRGQVGIR
jgi:Amidohydrolase family